MDRLILHVGTMKSGTTFIQDQLFAHQESLLRHGVLVPGRHSRDHALGTRDVLGHPGRRQGSWQRLLDASDGPGTAVISMEFFARVPPEVARRVVDSVSAPVHVVVAARDLNRQLPAMWQETLKNGRTWTWGEYLRGARSFCPVQPRGRRRHPSPEGRNFWRQQNLGRIVRTWREAAGDGGLSVVPVGPNSAGAYDLWERFARVVGFDPSGMEAGPASNGSLGAPSAQVLRRANELLEQRGLPFPAGKVIRKRMLANTILAARRRE